MFANATLKVGISQRVVATLVASALVLASIGFYHNAQAANLTLISDTLSTSNPSVNSAHTIRFTIPATGGTAITATDTITITFETFTVGAATSGNTTVTVAGGGTTPTVGSAGQDVTITNITASPGDEIVVAIDDTVITNPAVGSYDITIDTGVGDSGKTMVAIVDSVNVTASVDTQFLFNVYGTATSTSVNGTSTTDTTTPTEIAFGELTAGVIETLAQDLTVDTNAINGFSVTVESDGYFESANGANINAFVDGSDQTAAGQTWVSPTASVSDDTTWGHWGMTYEDTTDMTTPLGAGDFIAVSSTTPRQVFSHNGPTVATSGAGIGSTTVGYQIEISALQEAATDYQTTLTYIATPTF